MEFSDDSTRFIKYLLPKFKDFYNNDDKFDSIKLISSLYPDLVAGDEYYKKIIDDIYVKFSEKPNIVEPDSINSTHYSKTINEYIKKNKTAQITYKFNILKRKIAVHFTLFDEDMTSIPKYDKYIRLIVMWLYMCNKYTTVDCSKTLNVFFFLTPIAKKLPEHKNKIIGYDNVNTGMTYRCIPNNEIFIYRYEEWFKVFIHETFHSYGLDLDTQDTNIVKPIIKKLFPINSTFEIAEAYTEIWARLLNCCFASYETMKRKNEEDFILYLQFTIHIEKMFSLFQMKKILGYMDLTYENLWSSNQISDYMRKNMYREESNVFSYFVLAGIFMNDFGRFTMWCKNNNNNFIKFGKSRSNANNFGKFIELIYKDKKLLENINSLPDINKKNKDYELLHKTGRMTCVEIKL